MVYTKSLLVDPSGVAVNYARAKSFTFTLTNNAGAYALATATGGDILVLDCLPYNDAAAVGLTSVSISTDDTTPVAILASTLLAAMTGGKNLTALTTPFVLKSGKKIVGTIVGTGSGGTIKLAVLYLPLASGASLA